ncbi:vitellogenin 3, phosvitinless [Lampris incognitus]|uniref:vitellogenin 3, phosvitinless n=1 Tax=Lampris incognitus TaxID=2546036 RepID=UPI0024B6206A|nr:vitellogenin 3, phosvitinless [Lampris incognitus]
MQGFLLCWLLALASCETLSYEPHLDPAKRYEYRYEGMMNFGLGLPNLAESGIRIACKVQITGISDKRYMLQVGNLAYAEFNGFRGEDSFVASPKLSKRIADHLAKPFAFEFAGGHVGDIFAPAETPNTIVNIVRGILGFFQVSIKTTQTVYELEETGIYGLCQSSYAVEENAETRDLIVTQIVDFSNCREKAAMYRGMVTAVTDSLSKQRGESLLTTVKYVYTVKPTAAGGQITKAHATEQQHFSPFNVKGGNFKMQATKDLVLLSVTDINGVPSVGPLENKGSLVYKFASEEAIIPIVMENLQDPVPKIIELIKRLAEANIYRLDSATTEDLMKVYQLLRATPFEGLEEMWKQFAGNPEHRRWFLNTIVEINDARILKFLELRFKAEDVSSSEALQTLLLSFEHLSPIPELVEMAKEFLTMPFCKSHIYLWHTVVLSYGSLVYKHCAYNTPCPVSAVQPLLDMAVDALRRRSDEDMVIALKALGNAGHPASIKTIMRFLPGVAAMPVELPAHVLSAAVQSLRLLAARDPHSVRDITMNLFMQKELPTEIRILAFMILFESKPPMVVVSTVAAHLLEEKDLQVASFAYSYIRSFARSSTPDNHFLSTACNVAVKILAPKFGRLSLHYSKELHLDWFNDDFLIGSDLEAFMLRSATSMFPSEITMKGKFYFIGRVLQLVELGIRAEGIKELFRSSIPGYKGDLSFSDFMAVLSKLQDWETLPNDRPVLSFYSRASGQEWFFADLNKDVIQSVIKAVSPFAGKESPVWSMIENLQSGISWHKTKAFLIFETRYFQATTLGLPLEISKYYPTLNGITVNAKAGLKPPLAQHLGELLGSEISLETDGFVGCVKDFWVFHGINTDLFQCGNELKSKIITEIPWKFSAKVNIREKKFEVDFPTFSKAFEVILVNSNVYSVSRNIEVPDKGKMTPMMPNAMDANNEVVRMGPTVVKSEEFQGVMPNIWHPATKLCAESNTYGVGLCLDSELKRMYYLDEYPLYYFLGYTHMACTIVPVPTVKPVDKIHFEFSTGPSRHPASVLQLIQTLRNLSKEATSQSSDSNSSSARRAHHSHRDTSITEDQDSTPEVVFSMEALAISGNLKPGGYDATVYYTPEMNMANVQLIVSQVAEDANWKMCMDATVDKVHTEAKAHMRWGAECQPYEMSFKASTRHPPGSKPTLKAKVQWTKIPEYMADIGRRLERYIPGMAFFLRFYQRHDGNPKQEVSTAVVAASADSIDMKIKFPEYTVYRQGIPVPVPIPCYEDVEPYERNTTLHTNAHA